MDNFDRKKFLLDNELQVNQSIGKLLYLACLVGPVMFVLTQFGIFQIETLFCVAFTGYALFTCLVQHILIRNPKYHSVARFFGIFALEILIGAFATRAAVGIYISYCFANIMHRLQRLNKMQFLIAPLIRVLQTVRHISLFLNQLSYLIFVIYSKDTHLFLL